MSRTTTAPPYPTVDPSLVRSTELRQFHVSTEPRVVAMLSAVPGYIDARTALGVLAEARRRRGRPTQPQDATATLARAIADAALAGVPIDDLGSLLPDLGGVPIFEGRDNRPGVMVASNATEALLGRVEGRAFDMATSELLGRLDSTLMQHNAVIFAALTEQVEEMVDRARTILGAGGRIQDAEDAIAQNRVEEWRASTELLAEYAELRRLQVYWSQQVGMNVQLTSGGAMFAAFVRNPTQVYPDLIRYTSDRPYQDVDDERAFQQDHPGGIPSRAQLWPSDWVSPDALWWFAEHRTARPWVPTEADFDGLVEELQQSHVAHRRGASRADDALTGASR